MVLLLVVEWVVFVELELAKLSFAPFVVGEGLFLLRLGVMVPPWPLLQRAALSVVWLMMLLTQRAPGPLSSPTFAMRTFAE